MRIVVIGGSGLIGSKVVRKLGDRGHQAVAASPASGVNAVTGEGLKDVLVGADAVVDVANSPSFEPAAALAFFESAGKNLRVAETDAGVKHHVALSVVGTDRLVSIGYFRAKLAQEKLIEASGVPFSIVRATQFCEFIGPVAQAWTVNGEVHAPSAQMQPIAAEDVAAAVVDAVLSKPTNRMQEVAGPEPFPIDELIRTLLAEQSDTRKVITDDAVSYFGMILEEKSLLPGPGARLAPTHFAAWLRDAVSQAHSAVR